MNRTREPSRSGRTIGSLWLAALVVTALVVGWLVMRGLSGHWLPTPDDASRDSVKIGLSVVGGIGAAFALYLAWRRQLSTEADHDRQERVATATEADAAARRITELYTAANEQLGSDKPAVRLGGLYAFERLAQANPEQRQTIVNVLCAYLRMPYTLPDETQVEDDSDTAIEHRERVQEREVRLTAQRVLANHLRPGTDPDKVPAAFWSDMDLDLSNALLIDLDFSRCRVRGCKFAKAIFSGFPTFHRVVTTGRADFNEATFTRESAFFGARFDATASFDRTVFRGSVDFSTATFSEAAFHDATFAEDGVFQLVTFEQMAIFGGAKFHKRAAFDSITIGPNIGIINFDGAIFNEGRPSALDDYLPVVDDDRDEDPEPES